MEVKSSREKITYSHYIDSKTSMGVVRYLFRNYGIYSAYKKYEVERIETTQTKDINTTDLVNKRWN